MSTLIEFIKTLIPHLQSQKEQEEAYLAESSDVYDLERRMREIDTATRNNAQNLVFGTLMP
jgi:hypothetical protein